jgi:adenosine/AMP kinase
LRNAYPINLLNVVQNIPEVCSIFCATANPVEVIVAKTEHEKKMKYRFVHLGFTRRC